jgi:hypothetical protein
MAWRYDCFLMRSRASAESTESIASWRRIIESSTSLSVWESIWEHVRAMRRPFSLRHPESLCACACPSTTSIRIMSLRVSWSCLRFASHSNACALTAARAEVRSSGACSALSESANTSFVSGSNTAESIMGHRNSYGNNVVHTTHRSGCQVRTQPNVQYNFILLQIRRTGLLC